MPIFEDHECLLTRPEEEVVKQFIDTGILIGVRRKFRTLCLISRSHPETSRYFKSHASCRSEEIKHLLKHFYIIHPFSKFNLFWEFFMFLLFCCYYVYIPISSSAETLTENINFVLTGFILDVLHAADIVKIFFTGYYDEEKSKVILQKTSIAKKYLKTYFFCDLFSCIHLFLYFEEVYDVFIISEGLEFGLRIFDRLKISRVPRWLACLELFRKYMGYSNYLFRGIRVVLIFGVVIAWLFSIHFFNEQALRHYIIETRSLKEGGVYAKFYGATLMLLLISCGRMEVHAVLEYLNAIFFLSFGFALQLFLYSQVLQVWTKYASAENKYHSLQKQFEEYMKYKNMPVTLRHRIMFYFEFKFHKHFFKESDVNNMVSPLLKQEILLHVTRNHIERVEFFRHLPENILMKVVGHMKSEIYLPGDIIVSAGEVGNSMFFILHGTVAVYTPGGKEICHLEDGAHFGEIALILSETRVATVIAITSSELFILKRSDFLAVIKPFPNFRSQLVAIATVRMRGAMSLQKREEHTQE